MKMKEKRAALRTAAFFAFLCALASCSRVGRLVVETPRDKGEKPLPPETVRYFFDRTESMKGFVAAGAEAGYGKALKALWSVKPEGAAEEFYEYGESGIAKYETGAANRVKGKVLRSEFYGHDSHFWALSNLKSDGERKKVAEKKDGGPLYGVFNFLGALEPAALYIIVTDLYEQQNYGAHPLQSVFSGAFGAGLAGALFTAESSFKGVINTVSSTDETASIPVPNGTASFFICIIGENSAVSDFSAALAKELKAHAVVYHNAVFLTNPVGNIKPRVSNPRPGNAREFSSAEYALVSMNIDREKTHPQAYRLLKFDASRWAAGLALPNINFDSFSYKPNPSFFYDDGKREKKNEGAASVWQSIEPGPISVKTPRGSAKSNALYIVVETANDDLSAGHYRVSYDIIPDAKTAPNWVKNLNAPDVSSLRESIASGAASGEGIKVLELSNVYRTIAEAYNKISQRKIYKDSLYLTKR